MASAERFKRAADETPQEGYTLSHSMYTIGEMNSMRGGKGARLLRNGAGIGTVLCARRGDWSFEMCAAVAASTHLSRFLHP